MDANKTLKGFQVKLSTVEAKIQSITRFGRDLGGVPSKIVMFRGMMDEIKTHYSDFKLLWNQLIDCHIENETIDTFPSQTEKDIQQACDRYYYEALSIITSLEQPPATALNASFSGSQLTTSRVLRVSFPIESLPKFDGNLEKWPFYRDSFTAMVHEDESVLVMEKYRALIGSLEGPALTLIKSLPFLESNYTQAWELLEKTFNNKRVLGATYLNKILDFKPFTGSPTLPSLQRVLTNVCESVQAFKSLNIENADDFILLTLAVRCLDQGTRHSFERRNLGVEFPTFKSLQDYLMGECTALNLSGTGKSVSTNSQVSTSQQRSSLRSAKYLASSSKSKAEPKSALLVSDKGNRTPKSQPHQKIHSSEASAPYCPVCKGRHALLQCEKFKLASPKERFDCLKRWSGCRICLSAHHISRECPNDKFCDSCNGRHHSWLHLPIQVSNESTKLPNSDSDLSNSIAQSGSVMLGGSSERDCVVLGTVIGQIRDPFGVYQNVRMILDSGSTYSFITRDCASRLGFQPSKCNLNISGIGQVAVKNTYGVLDCLLRPVNDKSTVLSTKAVVLDCITGRHPQAHIPIDLRHKYKNFPLADEQFWKPAPVELLLGSDIFYEVLSGKPVHVASNIPKLLPTVFGYVVGGRYQRPDQQQLGTSLLAETSDLMNVIEKFWLTEEIEHRHLRSPDDAYCEQHFKLTHHRTSSGRYVVSLPFRVQPPDLSSSTQIAKVRFRNLEQKFAKMPSFRESYVKFMREYSDLKHMSVASKSAAYMIPHHGVYKVNDLNPKLRVVFDASCKTSSGSLNDYLHAGPILQNDIGIIILRFRKHPIVFTADIVKAYRQILVNPKDRIYQHILWRPDSSQQLVEYELDTVSYGTKPAPFLYLRTLQQLVEDEGDDFPDASTALTMDTYIDDVVTGSETLEGAFNLKTQLVDLLAKGRFELSKWTSNEPTLLGNLSGTQNPLNLSLDDKIIKILGLQWDPINDVFRYNIEPPKLTSTKRSILSAIARIFDPLGYVSPVVCFAKIILQRCWEAKVGWDEVVPPKIAVDWENLVSELPLMSNFKISRHIPIMPAERIDVIGFCDASELAFGALIYLRIQGKVDVTTYLLKAKTKLAPLKTLSVPRLELSAALLLSRLYKSLQAYLVSLPVSRCVWFSDSTVALAWIKGEPSKLKTWVANRVVEVSESTRIDDWHHVRTHDNPADCSSRGLLPSHFVSHTFWINGPPWLCQPFDQWPIINISHVTCMEVPEVKGDAACLITEAPISYLIPWMEKFSSFGRILRIMAYVVRFLRIIVNWPSNGRISREELRQRWANTTRGEVMKAVPTIAANEYDMSQKIYVRIIQLHHFPEIVKGINPKFRSVARLNPFIDLKGIIRVGGRLTKAPLPEGSRFPILLPKNSHFTRLLVDFHHRLHLHVGPSSLHAILRNQFWILSGRSLVKHRIFRCAICVKATKQPKVPFMGDLPSSRFMEGRTFANVGVDFAGFFLTKDSLRRKAATSKAWLCIFVCMSSKAVHLELVSSLSTSAFLATLDRFIARRGLPARMFSDCGTNFVGANRELKELQRWYNDISTKTAIEGNLAPRGIEWSFNPPSAPNFGGLWEASVKSAKGILHKISNDTAFTFEELTTMFCRIEAIMNSRPLCPLSEEPDSVEALTPGHFIIGAPLVARPEPMLLDLPENRLSRWQLVQQRIQHFWKRWKCEYLHTLQERRKWTKNLANLQVGELVIIKDGKDAPSKWNLGRIVSASPGADGIVRVVEIQTATGLFKRPVSKLVSLQQVTSPESPHSSQS